MFKRVRFESALLARRGSAMPRAGGVLFPAAAADAFRHDSKIHVTTWQRAPGWVAEMGRVKQAPTGVFLQGAVLILDGA